MVFLAVLKRQQSFREDAQHEDREVLRIEMQDACHRACLVKSAIGLTVRICKLTCAQRSDSALEYVKR